MRIKALTTRILNQIRHDKRTVGLLLVVPIILLSLIYFIFDESNTEYNIGIINASETFIEEIQNVEGFDINIATYNKEEGVQAIKDGKIIALVDSSDDTISLYVDATNATDGKQINAIISSAAFAETKSILEDNLNEISESPFLEAASSNIGIDLTDLEMNEIEIKTEYIYGSEDLSFFDNYGAPLIGIIVFFLVFLIAGINFLGERTSGTLEKLLTTPIRRGEIILGYVFGFSVLAIIQSAIVTAFVVYILKVTLLGSIGYVFLLTLLTAICALSLGILLSTLAESEFQMIQFIPIVIIPQVFLCGLFPLSSGWDVISQAMPLYYTTHGLTEVMLRGSGFDAIAIDCLVLFGFTTAFVALNVLFLKKQRSV